MELPKPLQGAVDDPGARDDDAAETTEAARELSPVCDRCGFDGRRKLELSGRWADDETAEPSGLDGRGDVDVARKVVPKLAIFDADWVWSEKLGRPAYALGGALYSAVVFGEGALRPFECSVCGEVSSEVGWIEAASKRAEFERDWCCV